MLSHIPTDRMSYRKPECSVPERFVGLWWVSWIISQKTFISQIPGFYQYNLSQEQKMNQLENFRDNGLGLLVALGLSWVIWVILSPKQRYNGELYNDRKSFEWLYGNAKKRFLNNGGDILKSAFKKV